MIRREFLIGAILLATVLFFLAVQSIGEEPHSVSSPELLVEHTALYPQTDQISVQGSTSVIEIVQQNIS